MKHRPVRSGVADRGRAVLESFRKIFYLVGRERPGRWAALVAGAVAVSVLEMLGALSVYFLLTIIADPSGQHMLPVFGDVRDQFVAVDEATFLLSAAAVIGVFFVVRPFLHLGYAYVKQRLAHNAASRLSATLAEGYLRMPYAYHLRRNSAELVRNAHQNLDELAGQAFLATIVIVAESFMVFGLLAVMLTVAPGATALAVLIVGAAALLLLWVVQPRLRRLGARAQEMRKRSLSSLQQALHGIRDIKVLGREADFARDYRRSRDQVARSLYLRGTVLEAPRLVIETSLVVFMLMLFAVSIVAGVASEELLSTLGLIAYAGLRIQPSLQRLVAGLNNVRYSAQVVDDVYEDLRLVEQVGTDHSDGELPFTDRIRLSDVSFEYAGAERTALAGVDVEIRRGEVVGICGPTGGGKTTLTDLIIGLLEPTTGKITVDGVDVVEHRAAWWRNLGVVPQMTFLVDDTLRRNVALGVPDRDIDDEAVEDALEAAQLLEFVRSLRDGLDTVVGERGIRLSGGQRQRVAIARALYRKPSVLIFDEGTSALDTATESLFIRALERLRGACTIILVAHRLSTVRDCDRIFYVEGGRLAGVGTFTDLQADSPGFRALTHGA